MKFQIDGIDYEAAPEVIKFIEKLDAACKTKDADMKACKASEEKMKGELDASKAKCDELDKKVKEIPSLVNDAVAVRLELERVANVCLDSVDKTLDNRALKVAIIGKKLPAVKIDDNTSEIYIDAVLDSVKASFTKEENDSLTRQITEMNADSKGAKPVAVINEDAAKTARDKMINDARDAYKK